MGQQFELNLLDAREEVLRRKMPFGDPRGLAVIDIAPDRENHSERAHALKAQPSFLPDDCLTADAFRLTLVQCKWHITANMPAVEQRNMEGMHQLRVGLRRLRVALSSFGGDFRSPQLEAIRIRAKALSGRLAPARDLDVFSEVLFEPAATANGALDAFEILRQRAQVARRRAWDDAVVQVTGPGFRVFLGDLGEATDRCPWSGLFPGQRHATKGMLAFEMPCVTLADRMLAHRLKSARKKVRHLESLSDAQRHDLRISLKKLRYTAEFFAPFYESRKVAKFLSRLNRMQDILGALNDVAVARKTLDILVQTNDMPSSVLPAKLSFAAGIVYGWHLERAASMWDDAVSRWKKFARTETFWNASDKL